MATKIEERWLCEIFEKIHGREQYARKKNFETVKYFACMQIPVHPLLCFNSFCSWAAILPCQQTRDIQTHPVLFAFLSAHIDGKFTKSTIMRARIFTQQFIKHEKDSYFIFLPKKYRSHLVFLFVVNLINCSSSVRLYFRYLKNMFFTRLFASTKTCWHCGLYECSCDWLVAPTV